MSQDGTFSVIQGEIDGRPQVAMIDVGLRELPARQGLSFFLCLSTSLDSVEFACRTIFLQELQSIRPPANVGLKDEWAEADVRSARQSNLCHGR